MISSWTKHLKTDQEKAEFEREIRGSRRVLDRIVQLMREREQGIERIELDPKAYESPSWSHKQADIIGRKREIRDFIKLVDLNQKD